jgi:predicted phosphodiesterase
MIARGINSDTHGLLRPRRCWRWGADLILHAGNIGPPGILERLRAIAPVTAVRGNGGTVTC